MVASIFGVLPGIGEGGILYEEVVTWYRIMVNSPINWSKSDKSAISEVWRKIGFVLLEFNYYRDRERRIRARSNRARPAAVYLLGFRHIEKKHNITAFKLQQHP